jgi:hypothetical protein
MLTFVLVIVMALKRASAEMFSNQSAGSSSMLIVNGSFLVELRTFSTLISWFESLDKFLFVKAAKFIDQCFDVVTNILLLFVVSNLISEVRILFYLENSFDDNGQSALHSTVSYESRHPFNYSACFESPIDLSVSSGTFQRRDGYELFSHFSL